MRKATVCHAPLPGANIISIPAFREEGDWGSRPIRTGPPSISIPAFREEGDNLGKVLLYHKIISIPAFREEGDGIGP